MDENGEKAGADYAVDTLSSLNKRIKELEAEVRAGKELWVKTQNACKTHALRGDRLASALETCKATFKLILDDQIKPFRYMRHNPCPKCRNAIKDIEQALKG